MELIKKMFSADGRKWLYSVAGAIIALLVAYGALTADAAPLWLALVAALLWALGNVTAIVNTDSTGRAAIYGIALAVVGLLVGYRILEPEQAQLWNVLAAMIFGVGSQGLAAINVTPDVKGDDDFAPGEPLDEHEVQPDGQDPDSIPPYTHS